MNLIAKRIFVLLSSAIFLASCATSQTIRDRDPNIGAAKTFAAPYEEVVAAASDTLNRANVNLQSTEETDYGSAFYFSKSVSAFSWGEVGRVSVFRGDEDATKVVVTSDKRSRAQITGTGRSEFAETIFAGIDESLNALDN